jgi:tRNA-modifying protein YgfZ
MVQTSILHDRAVLALSGVQTRDFLQGLITNDVMARPDQAVYAALLTPQGKILFDFFVVPIADGSFLLDYAALRATALVQRLTLYRLRAKVEIANRPGLVVAAVWNHAPIQAQEVRKEPIVFSDPRLPLLGLRMIGSREEIENAIRKFTPGDYAQHRLALGIPDSSDLVPDQVFALDAGLEELNGVSFKKGCYVGQEVTARMKHRATARRRFIKAQIGADLPPGTPLQSLGRELGTLATGQNGLALALVRLDRVSEAEASGTPILAAGHAVTLQKPEWLDG